MERSGKNLFLVLFLVLTVALVSCAGSRTQESTGEYVDDAVISTKVKTELLADPDVSGLAIEVETFKGTVQLSGFVDSAEQSKRAEEIARSVEGVRTVKNDIIVKQ